MANTKNEHVSPKKGGWVVRREGSIRTSRMFKDKKNAVEYAGIIASNDGGSVISHKHNGQFKDFKHGSEIYVNPHKIAPILTGTVEIIHPVINNTEPIVETIKSI